MSIFSDYKVGALTYEEFKSECASMNLEDKYEQEHFDDDNDEDEDDDE